MTKGKAVITLKERICEKCKKIFLAESHVAKLCNKCYLENKK